MRFPRLQLGLFRTAPVLGCLAASLLAPAAAAAPPPQTLYVAVTGSDAANACESQADPCATIAHAVVEAEPEATIEVAAGTYQEPQIASQEPLALHGAGAGQTIVDGSSAEGLSSNGLIAFHPSTPGDIEVSGFTLEGARATAAVSEPTPILLQFTNVPDGSQVTVTENQFLADEALDPELPEDFSVGIFGYGSAAGFAIEGNRFEGMWQGVLLEHSTGAATLAGNEFADLIATSSGGHSYPAEGIYLLADGSSGQPGDAVTSSQLIVSNSFHDYAGQAIGVQAGYPSINPTTPNSFSDVTITGNRVALAGSTYPPDGDRPFAGVELRTGHADSTVSSANVSDNSVALGAPSAGIAVLGDVSGADVHGNRLAADPVAGLDASAANAPVDATDNWWGCNAGPGAPGCSAAAGPASTAPNLVLTAAASRDSLRPGEEATVRATIEGDSDGHQVGTTALAGTPVAFAAAAGSFSPPASALDAAGVASSTYRAASAGDAGATVTVDGQTVPVRLGVEAPPQPEQPAPEQKPAPVPTQHTGRAPVGVAANGSATIATLSCPAATCRVLTKTVEVKIGGKTYIAKVKPLGTIVAGKPAKVRIVLPEAARRALHDHPGKVIVKLKVRSSDGATATTHGKVRLKKSGASSR